MWWTSVRPWHAEAIRVEFDPAVVTYEALLDLFMQQHNPFQQTKTQYQSAVWPQTPEQERAVLALIARVEESSGRPVMTRVEAPTEWWDAEWYHQQYNTKNKLRLAAGPYIHSPTFQ